MRPRSIIAAIGLLIFCAPVFAVISPTNFPPYKPFLGLAYSPFRGNESPNYNSYPSVDDITYDLTNSVVFLASEIATYGMDGTLSNIPALCNTYNIKCYPCAFLGADLVDNTNELNALIAVGNQNFSTTRGLIVGSEALLYGYDPATLINNINYVRAATHTNFPVGTRDTPGDFLDFPQVAAACDFIHADVHPYWAQEPESNAVTYTIQLWQQLTNQFPGTRVEIGETGWPTGGTNVEWSNPAVVANVANQGKYLADFVRAANSNGIEYFIFDSRDEVWKTQDGYGTVETNWGIYNGDNSKKQSLIDYLTTGFSLKTLSAKAGTANLLVQTYEGDPYLLYATTNLLASPGNPVAGFSGAVGTNQTLVTITNSPSQPTWFYRSSQNF